MSLGNYAGMLMKRAAASAVMGVIMLALAGIGFGFFIAALYIWLSTFFGAPAACAITGTVLLFFALMILAIGSFILHRLRRRTPHLFAAATQSLGAAVSLGGLLIRAGPKRVLMMALVAGAVTEYLTTRDKPR